MTCNGGNLCQYLLKTLIMDTLTIWSQLILWTNCMFV